MYARKSTLAAAYQYLATHKQKGQLWTILHFDEGSSYFIFLSSQTEGQQMFGVASKILEGSGFYTQFLSQPRPSQLSRNFTRSITAGMADSLKEFGMARDAIAPGGHAEEWMIRHFDEVLAQAQHQLGQQPTRAIVLNSDSPCTIRDGKPSNNLPGWPPSCTQKLAMLAHRYCSLDWTVFYYKRFGFHSNKTDREIQNMMRASSGARGIAIYPYNSAMKTTAKTNGLP